MQRPQIFSAEIARLRFNNHKARFRAHSRLSFEGRNKDDPDLLFRHFSGPGHHSFEDVSIQLIDIYSVRGKISSPG